MSAAQANLQPVFDRSFWWFSIGFLLLMFALFIGPRLPDDQQATHCVVNVHLPGPFGIALNCDSHVFMRLAREPSALLEPLNILQSRPGLIFAAAPLAWALSPLAGLAGKLGIRASRPDIDPQRIDNAFAEDIPTYLAYIALNVAIVLATFCCFRSICALWANDGTSGNVVLTAIGFLLVTNDVVKAFVWSPHTQMFNILVPVFALYTSMRAGAGALVQRRFAIFVGIVTGLGGTAYPLFVIVLPCVAVCAFVFALRHGSRTIWSQSAINTVVLVLLALAPEALWAAFVRFMTGSFYQHEMVAFGQVTWIADAWHQGLGTVAATWWRNLERLLRFAAPQAVPLAAVLAVVAALGLANRGVGPNTRPSLLPLAATGILVSIVTAAFYASVGFIMPRLAYSVIPALIVVVAAAALAVTARNNARRQTLAFVCVAVVEAIYTIVKNGPYS